MTVIRRRQPPSHRRNNGTTTSTTPTIILIPMILVGCFGIASVLYLSSSRQQQLPPNGSSLGGGGGNAGMIMSPGAVVHQYGLPPRVQDLLRKSKVVGDRIGDIKSGKATVEEVLHGATSIQVQRHGLAQRLQQQQQDNGNVFVGGGGGGSGSISGGEIMTDASFPKDPYLITDLSATSDKPPMSMEEIITYITNFLHQLHNVFMSNKQSKFWEIWQAYHDLTIKTLYPWDREYLQRMPSRRFDDSIFLSLASYRDENCLNTIKGAYKMAKNPELLNVGLVQQNCVKDCRSGVLSNLKMEPVEPDDDCHQLFCDSPEGKPHCDAGRVRAIHVDEDESLGPYAARYFASKLWNGEQWYMQIDSHMFFAQDWDRSSVVMLQNAPSKKPVISHYPPPHTADLEKKTKDPAPRLCGPVYAGSDLESQIIRLEGSGNYDKKQLETPRFAPFTAAGYFVAHSDFLREVPFDPFLPWIFMGEEIIMSARLWTSGYDIFSPTKSVVSHIYVRRHKPKFWESVHRVFTYGVHNPLQMLILNRVKHQMRYPEASRDFIKPKSILTAVEQYSMGKERPVEEYLRIVGLDMNAKRVIHTGWCETGQPPPGFEKYAHLYK